jgi:hypothetical protein
LIGCSKDSGESKIRKGKASLDIFWFKDESPEEKLIMETRVGTIVLGNEDVTEIIAEIPEGHLHLRTTVRLADGSSITLQEATVAAIARAYVSVKTDPLRNRMVLRGRKVTERKEGYTEWQLLEGP